MPSQPETAPATASHLVADARYLPLATTLLQRMRLERPTGGIWEAADVQWWSRWADPVTRVGLVEPMRTEHGHERRGIASHLLAHGLARLAAHGCTRLTVGNDLGIYLRAGFAPLKSATAAIYSASRY